jgi:hypothetical protein
VEVSVSGEEEEREAEEGGSLEDLLAPLLDDSPAQAADLANELLQGVEVRGDKVQGLGLVLSEPDVEVDQDMLIPHSAEVVGALSDLPLLLLA